MLHLHLESMNKMTRLYLFLLLISLLSGSCSQNNEHTNCSSEFVNLLDLQVVPQEKSKLEGFGFSDLGAWHGYALPHTDSSEYVGGFSGPLLMKMHGEWFSKALNCLKLKDSNGHVMSYLQNKTEIISQPGRLMQKFGTEKLDVTSTLFFVDNRTAMVRTVIENRGGKILTFVPEWTGEVYSNNLVFNRHRDQFNFILPDSSMLITRFSTALNDIIFEDGKLVIQGNKIQISDGEKKEVIYVQRYSFNEDKGSLGLSSLKELIQQKDQLEADNINRWKEYINKVVTPCQCDAEKRLAVKCIETLITNWRSPAGALKHNGIFPSTAYQGFYGFWVWDSWKHSAAVVKFDPFLAKEGIRSMFDFQNERGMLADCVYFDPSENNWRNTKAPLAAWSVYKVFETTGDSAFVKEMVPKLDKYHKWWYKDRDHDRNGICEYGSTDGTLIAAKWESGMDNAVRFDSTTILKNSESAWSFNQESVDLNAYLQKEKEYMAHLCDIAGNEKLAKRYKEESIDLAKKIRLYFWNEDKGYFFDREMKSGKFITDFGPEGWTPLWTGLASEDQARRVLEIVLDTTRFNTFVPFPTLDAKNEKFNPQKGYWRGPVWLDQAHFGIESLRRYGMNQEASDLTQKLLRNAEGLLTDGPIRENYHPISGKGLNAKHFSWSAAHLLLLLETHDVEGETLITDQRQRGGIPTLRK